jgi:hypothetical protein
VVKPSTALLDLVLPLFGDIDHNTTIKHIAKDVTHEILKNCGTIGKTKRHDLPLKQTILGLKGSLPFYD